MYVCKIRCQRRHAQGLRAARGPRHSFAGGPARCPSWRRGDDCIWCRGSWSAGGTGGRQALRAPSARWLRAGPCAPTPRRSGGQGAPTQRPCVLLHTHTPLRLRAARGRDSASRRRAKARVTVIQTEGGFLTRTGGSLRRRCHARRQQGGDGSTDGKRSCPGHGDGPRGRRFTPAQSVCPEGLRGSCSMWECGPAPRGDGGPQTSAPRLGSFL